MNTTISDAALPVVARYVRRTSNIYRYIAEDLAVVDAQIADEAKKPEAVRLRDELRERAEFEKWAGDQGFCLDRTVIGGDDAYQQLRTQGPWEAWQAALAEAIIYRLPYIAARPPVCPTCDGSRVDPGGKPACRNCVGGDQLVHTQLGYTLSDVHDAYSRGKAEAARQPVGEPVGTKNVRQFIADRAPNDEHREDVLSGDYDHTDWFAHAAAALASPPAQAGHGDALHAAVGAIYFDDSSDYQGALWNVVRALDPVVAELLERDPAAAYEATKSGGAALASRQPVDADRAEKALRDACEYVGQRSDGDMATLAERCELWMRESRVLIDSQKKIAARQPVGQEPFGHVYRVVFDADHASAKREWSGAGCVFAFGPAPLDGVQDIGPGVRGNIQYLNLYDAPPAQAEGLGQFREAVDYAARSADFATHREMGDDLRKLLALIDSQAVK